ncbi:phage integrase SAM-like domain-containing protein [Bacillus sp. SM2101]|uniref:phage integrase SAM-like domain-containing protein n=1 Tax=Bacillus sp. SM2101 TaxID=2805366 RepID=UPI001BDDD070
MIIRNEKPLQSGDETVRFQKLKGAIFMRKKTITRRYNRDNSSRERVDLSMSMSEMFEQFMYLKKAEGLTNRTIDEYYIHYEYFMRYAETDLPREEMTTELFCSWIAHMIEEMELAPVYINIRVRTMRVFVRYAYEEKGWIDEPVHKRFKPIKAPIDIIEAYTSEEVK